MQFASRRRIPMPKWAKLSICKCFFAISFTKRYTFCFKSMHTFHFVRRVRKCIRFWSGNAVHFVKSWSGVQNVYFCGSSRQHDVFMILYAQPSVLHLFILVLFPFHFHFHVIFISFSFHNCKALRALVRASWTHQQHAGKPLQDTAGL